MNVYCIKGLVEIKKVSEDIAVLFCPHATSNEILGDLKDMKFVFAEYLTD